MESTSTRELAPYLLVKNDDGLMRFIVDALKRKISYEERNDLGRLVHGEVLVSGSV